VYLEVEGRRIQDRLLSGVRSRGRAVKDHKIGK
jgi:hypothetical protein